MPAEALQNDIKEKAQANIWDKEQALQRLLKNNDLLTAITEQFIKESADNMDQLTEAINAFNWEQAKKVIHIIKKVMRLI